MLLKTDDSYPDFDEIAFSDYKKLFIAGVLEKIYPWCKSLYQNESSIDLKLRLTWSYADNLSVYNDWKNNTSGSIDIYAIVVYNIDSDSGIAFVGSESECQIELQLMSEDVSVDFDLFVSSSYIHYDDFYSDLRDVIETTNKHAIRPSLREKFKIKDL